MFSSKYVQYIHEDRRRCEHERQRLSKALERNNQLTRTIAAIIPEFVAGESLVSHSICE